MDEHTGKVISSGDFVPSPAGLGDAPEGFSGRVPHILLVDADPTTAGPLRGALVAAGYRVTWLETGRQAIAALRGPVLIDLVILDYFDPQVNGAGILQDIAVHAIMQRPAVVIASSWLDEFHPTWRSQRKRLRPVAQNLIKAYVTKPYTLTRMDGFIRSLLGAEMPAPTPAPSEPAELNQAR